VKADLDEGAASSRANEDLSSDLLHVSVTEEQRFPLSYMQEQLWFLARLNPGLPVDNLPFFIDTPPSLDELALKRSLQDLVQRHEALRTTFVFEQGRPVQVVHPPPEIDIPSVSLEELPGEEQEQEARRISERELRKPFDFERGPVFRAVLIRLSGGRHKFIFIVHHAVIDGFSAYSIFFPELISLYSAYASGQEPPHPPAALQIRHYAFWQRQRESSDELAEHMRYWKRQLKNLPDALRIPTDRPRPMLPSARGADRSRLLPSALISAAKVLARKERSTLFTVLLAAFFALLWRYTEQDDIFIGTAIADRNSRNKRSIFGPLINMVVLRADMSGDLTFRQVIQRAREVLTSARDHSDVPFETLVNELRPRRSPGQNPLFQVAFNLQSSVSSSEWSITHRGATTGTTSIDLIFELQTASDSTHIHAQYCTDLFDDATIERMIEHYGVLLQGAVHDADTPIGELPLMTGRDQKLLKSWNEAPASISELSSEGAGSSTACGGATFVDMFELQVERSSDATAVVYGEQELSYRELNLRANRLAHRLRAMGVGPEVRVCILLDRSTEMLVAILSVLKAGGAYVPLDPAYPPARISFLLEDARPAVVLTQRNMLALLPKSTPPTLVLDAASSVIIEESEQNLGVEIRPESAAYIIYTSGSTGRPKGVVIEHRNAAAFLSSTSPLFTSEEIAFVLGAASISFDLSILELLLPLCRGGAIVLARNLLAIPEVQARDRVTLLSAVPSAMTVLLDTFGIPASIQTVILAGERLDQPLAERVLALGHVRKLYNIYGPTECTTYSTIADVRAGEVPTIGRTIPNTSVYVLGRSGEQVPVGISGELYIAGAGVTRGYLDRPELTAERFVPSPFGTGERLYRTGDLVRYTSTGELAFIGRVDHQVKLRGFRVELGEIEATLVKHPLVREVAVLKVDDASGDARLVAYVAPEPHATRSSLADALRRYARGLVPGYMVPASFVFLDDLPKTASGKIDRRALPLDRSEVEARPSHVEPKEELELLIAEIWQRVLQVEVGVHDNFFDLGGNSLLLVRVYEALRRAIDKDFSMLLMLTFPTVRSLAESLSSESVRDPSLTRAQDRARKQKLALGGQRQRLYIKRGRQGE
jgi:amino acid adenylation domain-containing protein